MTDTLTHAEANLHPTTSPVAFTLESSRARRLGRIQFCFCLIVTCGVLVCLLWPGDKQVSTATATPASSQGGPVRCTESGHIRIQPDSPLFRKLETVPVMPTRITAPVLTATGTVVASLRPARGGGRDWQFNSPELLAAYTDWQKAVTDIAFARTQVDSIRSLGDNRVAAQDALVARLRKLVEAGTNTESDLAAAQTELLEAQIQGRKDLHEAETASRVAQRSEAFLRRQLEQAGVDPELLRVTAAEVDIVVADVPEVLVSRVKLGQGCEAKFVGVGAKRFTGTVRSISPVLSKDQRSLRVLFTIDDPDDSLRPGMFADIGLGTDSRAALLAPLAGVVHVGRFDYLLVHTDTGDWRPSAVQIGEVHEGLVEVLDGLTAGAQIIGMGAILLKPIIAEAVEKLRLQTTGDR